MNYRKEHIIYTLLWIVLYLSPVMSMYMRMSTNPHIDFSWEEILNAWKFNTVWVVLFSIHNFLLAPILIIKRRTWLYTALAMSLLAITMCTLYVMRPDHRMRHPKSLPPTECKQCNTDKECPECEYDRPYSNDPERRKPEMRLFSPMPLFGPGEMVAVFGGLLLMGMNLGVKLYFRSQEATEALTQIEKHALERQLQYLKYQVNPHFFMNTLNNIHALVDIDPERAKASIVELSKLMRYVLYEGNNKLTPLSREVQFLRNYVQLMSMRYNTGNVSISLDAPDVLPDSMLPPLLLVIFVENAFKHGISYRTKSFVEISLQPHADRLLFSCRNSRPEIKHDENMKGGVGLSNVRRRLDLLFPNDYTLDIKEEEDTYTVKLEIPLTQ
ncbi:MULTISPECIES: sensor histidine kinase [Prevotellaceae]|uniref:sensor histidine kinase n=1 Tax=Leyella stercorea TaxID=363265 RepID=UPI001F174876|nr:MULTISPECIES: histidine kinase [Prevotellaceae]MCI7183715.1 histidine kinase [Prevotella sp.]